MPKRLIAVTLSLIVLCATIFSGVHVAYAADPVLSDDAGWVPAYPSNNQNDYLQDQQTGSGSVSQDIVGNATYPSTYIRFSSTDIAFQIRISNIDGTSPYEFKNFAFVGVDADVNGSVDFFLGVYNPTGNNGRVGIYSAASGYANISPSTTGISGKPLLAFKPVYDVNYAITQADSSFNGTTDYFISFRFSVADIAAALAGTGYTFTASTPFRFMTGTAAQDNSFNQDLNGMDDNGWSSGRTWTSLGVFSDVVTPDGSTSYYTVTFDKNTGDTEASPAVKAVEAGQTLGSLPSYNPTKRGMYFQEWNTQPDGTGDKVTANTAITGNTTFYAIWSSNAVYTVTFNLNGGNISGSTSAVTVPTVDGVVGDNMPANPTQTNKYFMGWLIDGTSDYFNSATEVTSNTFVTAQWANNANKVAIFYDNYDASGGSEIARVYSNGNSNNFNGTLPVITRPGYIFGGWYLEDKTCTTGLATDISAQGNYYAKWTPATYTVTFDQNYAGSPAATTQEVTGGVLGTLPTDPTRTSYQFIEWNRNADGTGEAMYPSSLITSDTTIYAIWELIQDVAFYTNGGEFYDSSIQWSTTAIDGKLTLLPQPPSRDGFTFLGWGTSAGSSDPVSLLDVTGINELYAIWSPVKTVTFNENYGATPATTDVLTAYGSVLYIPQDPTRTSYGFNGWNTQSNGGGNTFTLSSAVNDDMVVYAMWELAGSTYTVSFDTNGGSSVADQITNEITNEPVSEREGYTLEGWYTDDGFTDPVSFPYTVAGDITLHANWTPNTYTVSYNINGGDGGSTASSSHIYDAAKALTANGFMRQYYTFAGWATSSDGAVAYSNGQSVLNLTSADEGVVMLYAKWAPNTYTVSYNINGGDGGSTASSSHTCDVAKALTANGFTRENYTFAGWALSASGGMAYNDGQSVLNLTAVNGGVVTLYAKWAPNTYTVSYNINGGDGGSTASSSHICDVAKALTANGFTRENYTFAGWALSASGGVVYSDGQSVLNLTAVNGGVVTLYAKWTPQPDLASSDSDGTIYTSGRITLTPNIPGGTWTYDPEYLIYNDGVFTALKTGTTTVTYTVDGVSVNYTITIESGSLPSTGQDFALPYILAALSLVCVVCAMAIAFMKKRLISRLK